MAKMSKKGTWYTGIAVILGAIGTFLVTTEPIFHYSEMFERTQIDTTKVANVKNLEQADIDSLIGGPTPRVKTFTQITKELEAVKKDINDTLKPLVKKHDEILQ